MLEIIQLFSIYVKDGFHSMLFNLSTSVFTGVKCKFFKSVDYEWSPFSLSPLSMSAINLDKKMFVLT